MADPFGISSMSKRKRGTKQSSSKTRSSRGAPTMTKKQAMYDPVKEAGARNMARKKKR